MLSLERCNEILNGNERRYSQKQVEAIREYLYQLAELINESKLTTDEELRR
jgi:hypothetical protein